MSIANWVPAQQPVSGTGQYFPTHPYRPISPNQLTFEVLHDFLSMNFYKDVY